MQINKSLATHSEMDERDKGTVTDCFRESSLYLECFKRVFNEDMNLHTLLLLIWDTSFR